MKSYNWEDLNDCSTQRLKVPGGWLVKDLAYGDDGSVGLALTFFPDPEHLWKVS